MINENKFCSNCGEKIDVKAVICPKCGVAVKDIRLTEEKNPGIAAVLSFFFIGLGQIYNGQIGKGMLFIIIGIVLILTMFILIGFLLYPLFWVFNIYDAYDSANKINNRMLVI